MKKILLSIMTIMSLILAACTGSTETGAQNPEDYDNETIKIGSAFSLSGEVSGYGTPAAQAIRMAADEINADGGIDGKPIELIEYDTQSVDTEAAAITTRLATDDKVSIIMGPDVSGSAVASLPAAQQANVPLFAVMASLDGFTTDQNGEVIDQAWRVAYPDSYQGKALAQFAIEELEADSAAILGDNSTDYAVGLVNTFQESFDGEITATENYTSGETDFSAVLTNLSQQDFDILFIPGYYEEAGPIIKQAREMGITQPILGPDGFGNSALYELSGAENMNDVYYTTQFSALNEAENVQEFMANYEENYGEPADMFAAMGYDAMYVAKEAIERAGSAVPADINAELANTTDFEGVTGTFSIDEQHNPIKTVTLIEVQNGEDVRTYEIDPE